MGPSSYRRVRIVEFAQRLIIKKEILRQQMEQPEFADLKDRLMIEVQTLDTVIRELVSEFEMSPEEFR